MSNETKTVAINVTRDDIYYGNRADCHYCPIALALRRAEPRFEYVSAGSFALTGVMERSRLNGNQTVRYTAEIPHPADKFIYEFDCGKEVEPFFFTVEFERRAY